MMARISEHVSTLALRRHALGAVGVEERARIHEHLSSCERCQALRVIQGDAQARFTAHVLPRQLPALETSRPLLRGWLLMPALAAAAAVALIAVRGPGLGPAQPDLLSKGSLQLGAYASRGGKVVPVSPGATLSPGDRVRFVVDGLAPSRPVQALVVSVDGRGAVSVYFPFGGSASAPLQGRDRVALPGSVVLDDAPGPERVFALFSSEPFTVEAARPALDALARAGPEQIRAALELEGVKLEQRTLWFEKDVP
jgi:hypothetical protein